MSIHGTQGPQGTDPSAQHSMLYKAASFGIKGLANLGALPSQALGSLTNLLARQRTSSSADDVKLATRLACGLGDALSFPFTVAPLVVFTGASYVASKAADLFRSEGEKKNSEFGKMLKEHWKDQHAGTEWLLKDKSQTTEISNIKKIEAGITTLGHINTYDRTPEVCIAAIRKTSTEDLSFNLQRIPEEISLNNIEVREAVKARLLQEFKDPSSTFVTSHIPDRFKTNDILTEEVYTTAINKDPINKFNPIRSLEEFKQLLDSRRR